MQPGVGRGAPEIDILEAMAGEKGKLPNTPIQRPYFSSSYQVRWKVNSFLWNYLVRNTHYFHWFSLFVMFYCPFQVAPGIDKNRPILMHQPKPVSLM